MHNPRGERDTSLERLGSQEFESVSRSLKIIVSALHHGEFMENLLIESYAFRKDYNHPISKICVVSSSTVL